MSSPYVAETRRGAACIVGFLVATSFACSSDPPTGQPAGWDEEVRLTKPDDLNPDPHVLEVNLDARVADLSIVHAGPTTAWTFNGTLPGPLLELTRGDRLVVHFTNHLPGPTTIHWHGVRVPAAMDGMPGHSQPEIPSGGSFDYDFIVPDAGLFWYHPHIDTSEGVASGLYGAIYVKPQPSDPEPMPGALGDDLVLVLSDMGIADDGSLQDSFSGGDLGALFGREGNTVLTNGRPHPSLNVKSGRRQRWHIVNAARSRYFNLVLPGHRFTVIGTDGGLLSAPVEQDRLLILPGGRADVLVTPKGEPNGGVTLTWEPIDRGFGTSELRPPEDVLRIFFEDRPKGVPDEIAPKLPHIGPVIEPLDTTNATPVHLDLTQAKDAQGHLVLGINGIAYADSTPIQASVGETQVWTITNTMEWAHPFHLHGFFFQTLDDDGNPESPLAWRDTVDIPVHGRRKFVVRYDNRPGMWMFHCHILDHEEKGMMGMLEVLRP